MILPIQNHHVLWSGKEFGVTTEYNAGDKVFLYWTDGRNTLGKSPTIKLIAKNNIRIHAVYGYYYGGSGSSGSSYRSFTY